MDMVKIRGDIETLLRNLDLQSVDWRVVVGQARDIITTNAPDINDFNVKIGKDVGNKFNVEIVVPMVFKF